MEILIPIIVICIIFFHVGMYVRVVFLRRHLMLGRVMAFLEHKDVPDIMKEVVKCAFIDTVSISLPLHMIKASQDRGRHEDNEELREFASELDRLYEQDESIIIEFNEIIEMMFRLNFKFNFILSFYAAIRRCRFGIQRSPEVGGEYFGYRYQH